MSKNKKITKVAKEIKPWVYFIIILMVCFVLYGQSIGNNFNIDDDYVYENHPLVQKGISGIPDIFSSRYNTRDEQYFGYRPLTIAIYAVEFELFGTNPHTAHFLNIIYYFVCCALLFYFLSLILKEKFEHNNWWIAFMITLVFAAHAMHTEVVLSIKNREEIISMILGLIASILSYRYFIKKKIILLIIAIVSMSFAFLAKESAIVFLILIPLTLLFFKTDIKFLTKFKLNTASFSKIPKKEKLLIILLLNWIIAFLVLTPYMSVFGDIKIHIHSLFIEINEFLPWAFFVLTYLLFVYLRYKNGNSVKLSRRNVIAWTSIIFFLILIIIAESSLLGFLSFFLFIITLLPQNKDAKPIFELKLFENSSKTIIWTIIGLVVVAGIVLAITYFIPKQALPETNAPVFKWQNPAFEQGTTIFDKIAIALYSLIYYLKLLIIPFPLRFYYGYKMIPDVSIFHPIVLLSLALHIYLLIVAFRGFNKRNLISYGILFYFIAIFPFANTFFPLTGIIAERMLFVPSIGFSIAFIFVILWLTKTDISAKLEKAKRIKILLIAMIIILPNTLLSVSRNADWKDRETLFAHDIQYLDNSAKANTLYGNLLIGEVYTAVKNNLPVANYKNQVELAIKYFNRSVEIDSTYSNPWHNLGYINMILYKNYELAEKQFTMCLNVDSTIAAAYLNRGITNFYIKNYKQSIQDLEDYVNKNKNYKDKELDKAFVFSAKSYLALGDTLKSTNYYILALDNLKAQNLNKAVLDDIKNHFILVKDFMNAVKVTDMVIKMDPSKDFPYVEKGNFYLLSGDTIKAVENWEIAFEKFNGNFNIGMTLSGYYRGIGNNEKADYFYNKAVEYRQNNPGTQK